MEKIYRTPIGKKSKIIIAVILVCVVFGIALGAFFAYTLNMAEFDRLSNKLYVHINTIRTHSVSPEVFAECLIKYGKFLFIIWFLAFFPIGAFASPLIVFAKGLSLGFTTAIMIQLYQDDGLWFVSVLYLPQNIFLLTAYCYAAFHCLKYSISCIRAKIIINKSKGISERRPKTSVSGLSLHEYIAPFLFGLLCVLLACIIEVFLTPTLWRTFTYI